MGRKDWGWGGLQGCVCRLVVMIPRKRGSWNQSAAQWCGGGVGEGGSSDNILCLKD